MTEKERKEINAVLKAIADGYPFKVEECDYQAVVVVENPYFQEDNGRNPNLVFTVSP